MNIYPLSKAGIQAYAGIRRFNGNAKLYEKHLKQFPQNHTYAALCKWMETADVSSAFTAAHTLKGIAGNLSMTKLYQDLAPMVEALRGGQLSAAKALFLPVQQDYEAILSALQEM